MGPIIYQIEADSELYNGCNSFACCNPALRLNSFVLGLKFLFEVLYLFGIFLVFYFSILGFLVVTLFIHLFHYLETVLVEINNQRLFFPKFV